MTPNPLCINPFFGHFLRCIRKAHRCWRCWRYKMLPHTHATHHSVVYFGWRDTQTHTPIVQRLDYIYEDIRTEKLAIIKLFKIQIYERAQWMLRCWRSLLTFGFPFSLFCCLSLIYGRRSHSLVFTLVGVNSMRHNIIASYFHCTRSPVHI